jgi:hypothetical protein
MGTQTQRAARFEPKKAAAPKRSAAAILVPFFLFGAVGGAFAFPQTRDPIMSTLKPAIQRAEALAGVKDEDPSVANADSLAAHDSALAARTRSAAAVSDSNLLAGPAGVAGDTILALRDTAHAPTTQVPTGTTTPVSSTTPAPVTLDTSLTSGLRDVRSRMQYGWIRVVINGGAALARIDGKQLGMTPLVARVEEGEHLVTVLGAGDTYLPSQLSVIATASDTAVAIFSTPEALQRQRELRKQQAAAAAAAKAQQQATPPATAPADSAAHDSTAAKPPAGLER